MLHLSASVQTPARPVSLPILIPSQASRQEPLDGHGARYVLARRPLRPLGVPRVAVTDACSALSTTRHLLRSVPAGPRQSRGPRPPPLMGPRILLMPPHLPAEARPPWP
ncbi:hypothetical protein FA95DRAFT_1553122 [Auriscalpium vulgare]|uniref:Uncharacterized protein n=1 Tax=Auriscalpium vulgare TaxID=40419 RepID=A0ACB8SAL5_9AGAM|nr:hypothetical protein FA95DRAFT_1553122 [Auriscalpium vulgare]